MTHKQQAFVVFVFLVVSFLMIAGLSFIREASAPPVLPAVAVPLR